MPRVKTIAQHTSQKLKEIKKKNISFFSKVYDSPALDCFHVHSQSPQVETDARQTWLALGRGGQTKYCHKKNKTRALVNLSIKEKIPTQNAHKHTFRLTHQWKKAESKQLIEHLSIDNFRFFRMIPNVWTVVRSLTCCYLGLPLPTVWALRWYPHNEKVLKKSRRNKQISSWLYAARHQHQSS